MSLYIQQYLFSVCSRRLNLLSSNFELMIIMAARTNEF